MTRSCESALASTRRLACRAGLLIGCLAGCLFLCGCGSFGPVGAPLGLGGGKAALSKAVEKDPFPDAASVNLQI
jgi:hypothetical protein